MKRMMSVLLLVLIGLFSLGCSDRMEPSDDGFLVANDGQAQVIGVFADNYRYYVILKGKTASARIDRSRYLPLVGDYVYLRAKNNSDLHEKYEIIDRVKEK